MNAKNRTLLLLSTGMAFSIIHLPVNAKDEHIPADSRTENKSARSAAHAAKAKDYGMVTDKDATERRLWALWNYNLDKLLVERIVKEVNRHEKKPQTQSCRVSYRISKQGEIDDIKVNINDENLRKVALDEITKLKGNSSIAFPEEVAEKPYVMKSTSFKYPPPPFSHLPEMTGDFNSTINQKVWSEEDKPH